MLTSFLSTNEYFQKKEENELVGQAYLLINKAYAIFLKS